MSNDNPLDFNYDENEEDNEYDLSFATSVDTTIKQDVSISTQPIISSTTTTTTNIDDDSDFHTSTSDSIPVSGAMDGNDIEKNSSLGTQQIYKTLTPQILNESSHPLACILHCLFKFSAFATYIFGGLFMRNAHSGTNFIIITVLCILFSALDFWVVKNITGRFLVRLRWWNMYDDGMTTSRWVFESDENPVEANKFDSAVFWTVLYVTPCAWGGLLFIGLLKFEIGWLMNVVIGLVLSITNVYGYWKCSSEQKVKFQRMVSKGVEKGAMSMIRNNLFGMVGNAMSNSQPQSQPQNNSF